VHDVLGLGALVLATFRTVEQFAYDLSVGPPTPDSPGSKEKLP